jgi:hypothetical protein
MKTAVFCVVIPTSLWADTDISEVHVASIFSVRMCRFSNRLGYIANLQRQKERGKKGGTFHFSRGKTNLSTHDMYNPVTMCYIIFKIELFYSNHL